MTHEVDDLVQLGTFEGEDPLVVAEGEGRDRVAEDPLVFPSHPAVFDEQGPAVGIGEQIPLVRADEGIDDRPVLRRGTRHEGWDVALVELGRPVHPDGNPHDMTLRCERFARQLSGRFNLPVHLTDERYSSAIAQSEGAGAGQLDAQAAAIILRQYLSEAGAPPAPIPSLPDPSAP
mgnify:CR=1 FL=1